MTENWPGHFELAAISAKTFFAQIEYCIIEPSPRRQEWQRETLKDFAPRVRWLSGFNDSTIQRFNGIIFSNELLDAFPVHRFGWDAKNKKWFEWGVAVEREKFVWAKIQIRSEFAIQNSAIGIRFARRLHHRNLPPPKTGGAKPPEFWRGKLLTIDYGLTADELFSPARTNGTLRAYFRHHVSDDLLANPANRI
jgi:SAM-dependent MidA family methyltransferase